MLKPHLQKMWCIPPNANAEFVWRMEDVLAVYKLPYDPDYPQVCLDEGSKQLIAEVRPPQEVKPGRVRRMDYEYERKGVCNLFMMLQPLRGWRHVKVTQQRTRLDYAECLQELVDVWYPDAKKIRLVQDNLNTHDGASLYEAFPPVEARRILDKIEWHYTPKHGSWLNMAETELSVVVGQCLGRRMDSAGLVTTEVAAWEEERNRLEAKVRWQFTVEDARVKLEKLYPQIEWLGEKPSYERGPAESNNKPLGSK
jgi:hypothetical protein